MDQQDPHTPSMRLIAVGGHDLAAAFTSTERLLFCIFFGGSDPCAGTHIRQRISTALVVREAQRTALGAGLATKTECVLLSFSLRIASAYAVDRVSLALYGIGRNGAPGDALRHSRNR